MGEEMSLWLPPADLDVECLPLCKAINEHISGVATVESCCGHGDYPFRIWVHTYDPNSLLPLLWALDQCHSGCPGWHMFVYTDCAQSHVTWMIEGPASAYADANIIAKLIMEG